MTKKVDGRSKGNNRKYKTEKQAKKARNKQNYAWSQEHLVAFTFRYNQTNDKSVIEKLKSVPNKADYLRQLILKDIENKGE